MTLTPDLIIRSQRMVVPEGIMPAAAVVIDGKIVDVVPAHSVADGPSILDAGEKVVMPGLVDSHVHINEPGRTDWEGFNTATRAAAAGGITMVADMPLNSDPVTTTVEALNLKMAAAAPQLHVDCGFYGGIIPDNRADVEPLIEAGVLGFKAFLIDSGIDEFPPVTVSDLQPLMTMLAHHEVPLLVHAEVGTPLPPSGPPETYETFLESRPRSWEYEAIRLMIDLCHGYGAPIHIVHLSSADAFTLLRKGRKNGWPLTVETCPHYLFFTAEEIGAGETHYKCAPPIRERENRERLWDGLRDGMIDSIVSDHSPCLPELKGLEKGNFEEAWGGISSLQFTLPAVWTEASKRSFTPYDLSRWMSAGPANLLGLGDRKGTIAAGYDADFVIWDPEQTFEVDTAMIEHKHKISPYAGKTLQGKVEATLLRGQKIYENGKIIGAPQGEIVTRPTQEESGP